MRRDARDLAEHVLVRARAGVLTLEEVEQAIVEDRAAADVRVAVLLDALRACRPSSKRAQAIRLRALDGADEQAKALLGLVEVAEQTVRRSPPNVTAPLAAALRRLHGLGGPTT